METHTLAADITCIREASCKASAWVAVAALIVCMPGYADENGYRVMLERVPGADEIDAGEIQAGIRLLEEQLKIADSTNEGEIWSTLCAAFIISYSLDRAKNACNKAVAIAPTYYALNNRGVYHVYTGNLPAAKRDFEEVRPEDLHAYLENLKKTDIRLVAAGNLELVGQAMVSHRQKKPPNRNAVKSADIEDLND